MAAGTLVMVMKPILALCLFTIVIIVLWLVLPRMYRVIRRSFSVIASKLRTLLRRDTPDYSVTPGSSRA